MTDDKSYVFDKKLKDLQERFFHSFCSSFPAFKDKIEIIDGIIDKENFCFSIKSPSDTFGSITFDVANDEITVFTEFDHKHFPTYMNDTEDVQKQIKMTCDSVIDYIKDYISGNTIIELHIREDKIIKVKQYHKDNISKTTTTAIYFDKDALFSKLKYLLGIKNQDKIIKRLNWFGELN